MHMRPQVGRKVGAKLQYAPLRFYKSYKYSIGTITKKKRVKANGLRLIVLSQDHSTTNIPKSKILLIPIVIFITSNA